MLHKAGLLDSILIPLLSFWTIQPMPISATIDLTLLAILEKFHDTALPQLAAQTLSLLALVLLNGPGLMITQRRILPCYTMFCIFLRHRLTS